MSQGFTRADFSNLFATKGDIRLSGLTTNASTMLARLTAGDGSLEEQPFETGTFTPTFSFATPGTLSVAYTVQDGSYVRIGSFVFFRLIMTFTPTLGTASGGSRIGGVPYASTASSVPLSGFINQAVTLPSGCTAYLPYWVNSTQLTFVGYASAVTAVGFGTSQFPTATARTVNIAGGYITAS